MRQVRRRWYAGTLLLVLLFGAPSCGEKNGIAPRQVPRLTSPRITYDEGGYPYTPGIPLFNSATGDVDSLPVVGANGPFRPALSPDGTRIALSRVQPDVMRGRQIVTMAVDGTDLRVCTADSGYHDDTPRWSPDGKHLAFTRTSFIIGGSDVFVVDANGRSLRNLTQQGASRVLDWSPDGTHILIQRRDDTLFTMATVTPNGGGFQALLQDAFGVGAADYSPDGTRIAVTRVFPASRLYVTNADGSAPQTLIDTTQVGSVLGCSWSPDGQSIVFSGRVDRSSFTTQLMLYRFGQLDPELLFPGDQADRESPNWGPKP